MQKPLPLPPVHFSLQVPQGKARAEKRHLLFSPAPSALGLEELVSRLGTQSCLPCFTDRSLLLTKAFPQFVLLEEANLFLFEIYKKQFNSKTVKFYLFHQNGLVMSGMPALSNIPGPFRAHSPSAPATGCALQHTLQRELSPSGPFHSGAIPKGPSREEVHYFVILSSLLPKTRR